MDRRGLLLSVAGLAAIAGSVAALAQTVGSPLDLNAFAKSISDPSVLEQVFTDVEFIHTWREQLSPRGYEKSDWVRAAKANRAEVWTFLKDKSAPGILAQQDAIYSYEKTGLAAFEKNGGDFSNFLKQIGVEPSGLAATRILSSLRAYALLNAATFGSAVDAKAKDSFFWPFC